MKKLLKKAYYCKDKSKVKRIRFLDTLRLKIKFSLKKNKSKKKYIVYRENSSDLLMINQVLVDRDYYLGRLARGDEILSEYNRIVQLGIKPLIIDCGANIGASIIHWATTFKDSIIVAVEPDPENFDLLKRNSIYYDNVIFIKGAVTSKSGIGNLVENGSECAYRLSDANNGIQVKTYSIPDIMEQITCSFIPFIVKIDIEGGEENLFSTNYAWFDKFYLGIIELHDWMLPKSGNSKNFLTVQSQLNRDFVYINENVFSIKNSIEFIN